MPLNARLDKASGFDITQSSLIAMNVLMMYPEKLLVLLFVLFTVCYTYSGSMEAVGGFTIVPLKRQIAAE